MMLGVHLHKAKKKTAAVPRSPRFVVYCATCDTEWQITLCNCTLINWIAGIFGFNCWKCDTPHRVVRVAEREYEQELAA